jgi:hypothetical protein
VIKTYEDGAVDNGKTTLRSWSKWNLLRNVGPPLHKHGQIGKMRTTGTQHYEETGRELAARMRDLEAEAGIREAADDARNNSFYPSSASRETPLFS